MRISAGLGALVTALLAVGPAGSGVAGGAGPEQVAPSASPAPSQGALLTRYCVTCHTEVQRRRGIVPLALDTLDLSNVGAQAEAWEKVVRKLRAGLMPPAGLPHPDRTDRKALVAWLEAELDRASAVNPNPGRTESAHRLNRAEYQNAIRDLLGLEMDVASLLPSDDASYGFDNIAGVLKLSSTLMERYLSAAQTVVRMALGHVSSPSIDYFRVADDRSQEHRLPGLAFGTRGGTLIPYLFPVDADYTIRVELQRDLNEGIPLYAEPQQLEISIDGERVGLFTLPGVGAAAPQQGAAAAPPDRTNRGTIRQPRWQPQLVIGREESEQRDRADADWEVRVPVKAGARSVQVAFIARTSALAETPRLPFLRPYGEAVNIPETRTGAYLRSAEISGPFERTGPGDSPSRRRIFLCQPARPLEETPCATTILAALARRAYRRPVTDADLEPLLDLYRQGREEGGFEEGIERALRLLAVSPEFLLRVERDPSGVPPNTPYRISDLELASRLSFFLWSSVPDDELLEAAERNKLRDPAVLEQQVRRMMTDERTRAFVQNFAGQWLFLRNLAAAVPVQSSFPDFDDTLRQAFHRETELFFESIVREDRSARDLLRADYTFLNERLARHYGIPDVKGSRFRRVSLPPDSHRGGLLRQGSVLTVTSYPDRTSPVVRGKWILGNLLGTPPPPPPSGVSELDPPSFAAVPRSMRERIAQHRANPACASCHAMMDPLGLALENFDGVGQWRTLDESGAPIDAAGTLPDGTPFEGPAGLTQVLLESDVFVSTLTEKMLTYALGRGLEYHDAPAVRAIVRGAARQDYRFSALILGIVRSAPFQMRMAGG